MLTVAEALTRILETVQPGPRENRSLFDVLGYVLADTLISDIDSPPFDKSLMDGYAVRSADVSVGATSLTVIEEVTAGGVPARSLGPGQATRIMTGAPVPSGADAVVPIEETSFQPSEAVSAGSTLGTVTLRVTAVPRPEQFILRRGASVARGTTVLSPGRVLRAQEIAALAELGHGQVQVVRRPRVAILATGDELVPPDQMPGPGQIRNSNEPMLAAQVRQMGAEAVPLGIARDEVTHLAGLIRQGLQADFLLLSGGVSAGKLDLVPSQLAAAGVRQVFHKLQMRPGKPLWFGVLERADGGTPCVVFGLPGNPVSSMVCCDLFVGAALRKWLGLVPAVSEPVRARLAAELTHSSNRPTYHPARLHWTADGPQVEIVDWIGSSDVCATVDANAVVHLPAGDLQLSAGASLEVFPWP